MHASFSLVLLHRSPSSSVFSLYKMICRTSRTMVGAFHSKTGVCLSDDMSLQGLRSFCATRPSSRKIFLGFPLFSVAWVKICIWNVVGLADWRPARMIRKERRGCMVDTGSTWLLIEGAGGCFALLCFAYGRVSMPLRPSWLHMHTSCTKSVVSSRSHCCIHVWPN
jgi:hypothetical protein